MLTIVGAVALLGFLFGLGARRLRLPSLLGYLVLGVVLGPSVLQVVDVTGVHQLGFVTDIALGFVAFSIGSELNLAALRKLGRGITSILIFETTVTFLLVTAWATFGCLVMVALTLRSLAGQPNAVRFTSSAAAMTALIIHFCSNRPEI